MDFRKDSRYKVLRQLGVNTALMARTAGKPLVMHGCKVILLALATGGRNTTLTLLAIDGSSTTLDLAFEAHLAPIRNWASAQWDNWYSGDQLQLVLR